MLLPFEEDSERAGAVFSPCRAYRYVLWRKWGDSPMLLWIMANPSTADAFQTDPTVRRTLNFAERWGYRESRVCNAFAFRSTDPKRLTQVTDPVGPQNKQYVEENARQAHRIVLAWGNIARLNQQSDRVREWLKPYRSKLFCLGTTETHGEPLHPLYLSTGTPMYPYRLED